MKDIVINILQESLEVKENYIRNNTNLIIKCADQLSTVIASGHKLLFFGNGGSAADAQHLAAEFVNRFRIERPPLAAIALTTDTSIITSIGNDYSFDDIFAKQVAALGVNGDVAIGISTSGNSPNVIKAIEKAKAKGLYTIGMSGIGGKLSELCDLCFCVNSKTTARIQETHITIGHILCELVDKILFPDGDKIT